MGFFLSLAFNGNTGLNAGHRWAFDIGVGGSGSEEVILADAPLTSNTIEGGGHLQKYFDISIPAGTRISARCQCTSSDVTDRVMTLVFHGVI